MSKLINAMTKETNYKFTENGGLAHKSTLSAVYDMFAFGGAYRTRSDADVILLFKNAYEEDRLYALKCLFYLRDVRGGQGERRFWRVCAKWLANAHPDDVRVNFDCVPLFGRWDDLYTFVGTPVEKDAFKLMKHQLALDVQCKTPSLLAKWLKSENTSSPESRLLGNKTRSYFNMTHQQYRKTLSVLRKRINVLERLMSANEWDKIEFDKIPSKAGFIYRNAFARHDVERMKNENVKSYADFAKDTTTKVNAKDLYPYEVVAKAYNFTYHNHYSWYGRKEIPLDDTERLMINKYWDNLTDYFNGANLNALAMVDTSGSMWGTDAAAPINVAISLGLYCAEKAKGPFHGNYISFSRSPQLIKTEGVDFVDKVERIYSTNLCENTNLEAAFNLVLDTAIKNHLTQEDLPGSIIVISDMEIDAARGYYSYYHSDNSNTKTMMENMRYKWNRAGYQMPKLIYWNVQARQNTVLDDGSNVSYVSGMSASIFEQIMKSKTGTELMLDKLNNERYSCIK